MTSRTAARRRTACASSTGTKGGRVRDVPLVTQAQWDLIDRAKAMVGPGQHLGRPGYSLQANTAHYYRVLAKVGITRKLVGTSGHGLRHERAGDEYQAVAGVPPPVRGGTAPDRATDRKARTAVAKLLGHNRYQISSCYLGSPSVRPAAKAANDPTPNPARRALHDRNVASHRGRRAVSRLQSRNTHYQGDHNGIAAIPAGRRARAARPASGPPTPLVGPARAPAEK